MLSKNISCPCLLGRLPEYKYSGMSIIHLVRSIFNNQLIQLKKKKKQHQQKKTTTLSSLWENKFHKVLVGHMHGLWVTQRGQVMRDSATLVFSAQLSHTHNARRTRCVMCCSGAHRCSISLPGHSTEDAGGDTHRQPHTFLRTRNGSCTCTGREDLVQ